MESGDSEGAAGGQHDAQQRLDALRKLATGDSADAPWMSDEAPAHRVSKGPRWRLWLAVALIPILVIVALVSVHLRTATGSTLHKPAPQVVKITPATELIACPTSLAWSPDLSRIAVLGYSENCAQPDTQYDTGAQDQTSTVYDGPVQPTTIAYIAIYDTAHGARLDEFSPTSIILQALHDQKLISPVYTAYLAQVGATPDQYIGLNFTHILWSLDRNNIYATFTCFLPDGPPVSPHGGSRWPGRTAQGVVVTDANGHSGRVFLHVSEPQQAGATIWDLSSGRVVGSLAPALPFAFQPAATAFAWTGSGALQPVQAGPAVTAVGSPRTGASRFAIWQPGIVGTTIQSNRFGLNDLSGVAVYATSFASLSPDGQYLAASIGVAGVLSAPSAGSGLASFTTPDTATLAQYGWQAAPHLPTRDHGLQESAALASRNGFSGVNGDVLTSLASVAWRPDGRFIAVSANTPTHALTVYDCVTGKQVATLTPPVMQANNTDANHSLIEWSPDGKRLAYFDSNGGTLTLWGSAQLPA